MTTEALSVWIQRAGRAGRDGRLSRAILLVEPSVAKKIAKKTPKSSKRSRGTPKDGIYFVSMTREAAINMPPYRLSGNPPKRAVK